MSARRFFAPGRVNLIGEHVDYSEGYVLPLAIDRGTFVTATPREDRTIVVRSADRDGEAAFPIDDAAPPSGDWSDYARGVVRALRGRIALRGAELAVESTLPLGGGLSSSASFELAIALALATLAGRALPARELALIGREAENGFIGLRSGIMDQLAAACGVPGHALLIDCRTEAIEPVPLPPSAAIAVVDSGVRHRLAGSAYNQRRAESEAAAAALGAATLRDVTPDALAAAERRLDPLLRRRARHVVGENARVIVAADALRRGDLAAAGAAMDASHVSLRDDYEVSIPELDFLAETARSSEGVYGARMTGGGFGGSIVALVERTAAEALGERVAAAYRARFDREAAVTIVRAVGGAASIG